MGRHEMDIVDHFVLTLITLELAELDDLDEILRNWYEISWVKESMHK